MADNGVNGGAPQIAQSIVIGIEWVPQTGSLAIRWPQVDDVVKLGMLEMAKTVLIEARAKAGMANPSPLIMPGRIAH